MSDERDVRTLRRVYAEWEKGNLRSGRELLAPEVVTVWGEDFPTAGTYHGPDEHAAAMREWLGEWEGFGLVAEDFAPVGDAIVAPFRVEARGRSSGVEVNRRWAHVWWLQEGKAVRFEVHMDVERAFRVAEGRRSGRITRT
jgi:ketosteroid isomerase-like protein